AGGEPGGEELPGEPRGAALGRRVGEGGHALAEGQAPGQRLGVVTGTVGGGQDHAVAARELAHDVEGADAAARAERPQRPQLDPEDPHQRASLAGWPYITQAPPRRVSGGRESRA